MCAWRSVAVQCVSFQNKNDDLTLNGGSVISNHFKPRLISNRHVIFQLQNSTWSSPRDHVTSSFKKIPENHQSSQKTIQKYSYIIEQSQFKCQKWSKMTKNRPKTPKVTQFIGFMPEIAQNKTF